MRESYYHRKQQRNVRSGGRRCGTHLAQKAYLFLRNLKAKMGGPGAGHHPSGGDGGVVLMCSMKLMKLKKNDQDELREDKLSHVTRTPRPASSSSHTLS
jgi:hypothetical protein